MIPGRLPPFFYSQDLLDATEFIVLDQQESRHARSSRRLREGDGIVIFNGKGLIADGIVLTGDRRSDISVSISRMQKFAPPKQRIHLASALPKGDRQNTMLDMVTQIGVTDFTPLLCSRSEVKITRSMEQRWHRIVIESGKQSRHPWLPVIHPAMALLDLINTLSSDWTCWLADIDGETAATFFGQNAQNSLLLVGPEGGFTGQERSDVLDAGAIPMSLGDSVLRVETAAVTMVSAARWLFTMKN